MDMRTNLPPTQLGQTYLKGCLTAMLPTLEAAQAAAGDIAAMGCDRDTIIAAPGERLLENEATIASERTWFDRVLRWFPSTEGEIVSDYKALAAQGMAVVAAQMPDADESRLREAVAAIRARGGVQVRYYRDHTIQEF